MSDTKERRLLVATPLMLSALAFLAGCGGGTQELAQAVARAEQSASAASAAQREVRELQERLAVVERLTADRTSPAWVSAQESAYGIADTTHGKFLISVESVEPYLDGFRLKLAIGNMTAATFNGAKLKLRFMPDAADQRGRDNLEQEVSIADTIRAGSWVQTSVIASSVSAKQLKAFSVGLNFNTVLLNTRSR